MDNKVSWVVTNKSSNFTYAGISDLSNLNLENLIKNINNLDSITIEIDGELFSGVLSEFCIVNNKSSNTVVRITLE